MNLIIIIIQIMIYTGIHKQLSLLNKKINNEKIKILSGSTSTSDNNTNGKLLSQDFIRKMFDNGYQYQYISSHFYDQSNTGILN